MHISTGLFGLLLTLKRGVYYHSGLFLNCGGEPHPLASKKIFCLLGIVLLVQWTFTRHPLDFLLSLNMLVLVCCPALLSNGHPWTFNWHPTLTEQVYPTVLFSSLAHVDAHQTSNGHPTPTNQACSTVLCPSGHPWKIYWTSHPCYLTHFTLWPIHLDGMSMEYSPVKWTFNRLYVF